MSNLDLDFSIPYPITALASSSSSSSRLVIASGPSIVVHTPQSTSVLPSPPPSTSHAPSDHPEALIRHIAISSDSRYIASVSDEKSLVVHTLSDTGTSYELSSCRRITKKPSDICFTPDNSIIISDKVGDVYLYPLEPNPEPESRPLHLALQSDPTLNPDATYLLGHVSVITASILTPDNQHIITADRDEHIRVSQFPNSYIIDRYLFGSDGFISALHIPADRPSTLISAGGEQYIRIWNWQTGILERKVDIWEAVLPHRRVRSPMRRLRKNKKKVTVEEKSELEETSFYHSPEGWVLPGGQGVCVKKIQTIKVGEEIMVVFFSEGAAAIHFFSLDDPKIHTHPLDLPIIDFTPIPSSPSQFLISLDPTWGILKQNPSPGQQTSTLTPPSLTAECKKKMENPLVVLEITSSGWVEHPNHPVISAIQPKLVTAPAKTISTLQLYPLLPLLPRWAGMEEDDDLAGPSNHTPASTVSGIISKPRKQPISTEEGGQGAENEEIKKNYTREELSQMGNKMLGRLKAQGVDVDEFLKRKTRSGRGSKRRRLRGKGKQGDEEGEGEGEGDDILEVEEIGQGEGDGDIAEMAEEVDAEEKINAA